METSDIFAPDGWFRPGKGPRYQQLHRHISAAIQSGALAADDQLPPERELAELAQISRVTVRKAVAQLVTDGLIEQRHGAGSLVRAAPKERLKQSLTSLVSFTENMQARGMTSTSKVLQRGVFPASPQVVIALGLSPTDTVVRIDRLRTAGGAPMALEASYVPVDILPNPELVETSLYAVLRANGCAPDPRHSKGHGGQSRGPRGRIAEAARRRCRAAHRTHGYLTSGRPIEFTSGLYRSDIYDFMSELRL